MTTPYNVTARPDYATIYAEKLVSGEITAGKKARAAAKRHLRDLERIGSDKFPYIYNPEAGYKVIDFMELLPDINTGELTRLALFQKFIVMSLYSWQHKDTGNRRFTKALISMARKNGKSVLVAGIALYELIYGKSPAYNRQIYSTANSKTQASIVFKMIMQQLKKIRPKSKFIRKATKLTESKSEIEHLPSFSVIRPLSKDTGGNIDGFQPLVGILDEYHASKTTEMMEVLESGQTLLENPLILIISTAGFKLSLPMYSIEYKYVSKILNEEVQDDNYFALVYEQDDEEEVHDESLWIKSNPLMEVEAVAKIILERTGKKLREALAKNELNGTLVKNFNMWRHSSEEGFIAGPDWSKNEIERPDITGRPVFIGVDLSRTDDLSAVTFIYPFENVEYDFYIDSHSFVATKGGLESKVERDKIDYASMSRNGYCTITDKPTGIINLQQVVDYILDQVEYYQLDVQGIYYDPYNASLFVNEMEPYDFPLVEVRQGLRTLSEPTKHFRNQVTDERIKHSGNPLLDVAVNNAILKEDNDAVQIDKRKNREKIDPIAAGMNAYTEAMYYFHEEDYNDYYEGEEFSF